MGFVNFYRRFILRFSKVIRFITNMLIGMVKGKKTGEFHWSKETDNAFGMLKNLFTIIPILRIFNFSFRIRMETDVSGFALSAVISQLFSDLASMRNEWHLITFWSRKMTDTKRNYEIYDGELLIIVSAFKE
jgi:hypothetical protein